MTDPTQTTTPLAELMGNTTFPRTPKRKAFLHLLFTDAMETGITSWAHRKEYSWSLAGDQAIHTDPDKIQDDIDNFYAVITPIGHADWGNATADLEGTKELRIDIDTIELGLMRYWEYCMGGRDKLGYPAGHPECNENQIGPQGVVTEDSYWRELLLADLSNGVTGDYDAYTLSAVIELALFDQVVYA